MHATVGTAALDLATVPQIQWYKISTGVYGPLLPGTVGMVLGRSSLPSQGLTVHPGIIGEDLKGN